MCENSPSTQIFLQFAGRSSHLHLSLHHKIKGLADNVVVVVSLCVHKAIWPHLGADDPDSHLPQGRGIGSWLYLKQQVLLLSSSQPGRAEIQQRKDGHDQWKLCSSNIMNKHNSAERCQVNNNQYFTNSATLVSFHPKFEAQLTKFHLQQYVHCAIIRVTVILTVRELFST